VSEKRELLHSLTIDRDDGESPRGGPNWLILGGVGVIAGIVGVGAGWLLKPAGEGAPPPASAESAPSAPSTSSAPVGELQGNGYVVARRRATVAAEVTGRVLEVRVEEGQRVKQGQVLAVLDATLARAELEGSRARMASADAEIAATKADLIEARANLERVETLAKSDFASDAALAAARARADALEARLTQAEAQRRASGRDAQRAGAQLDRYQIRAPFSGVVIDKAAQAGEIISPISAGGGFTRTGLCTIVDMESLEIEVDVSEAYIARVSDGQRVEAVLDAYPDVVFPAKVIATIPTASRDKAAVRVRIAFDQLDPRILPEMAIKVTFLEE
jgi:HlyD family secretion protein